LIWYSARGTKRELLILPRPAPAITWRSPGLAFRNLRAHLSPHLVRRDTETGGRAPQN
jgi:hypothetical protein